MLLKEKIHEIIFEADTKAGKRFDIWLIIFILLSVFGVMLSSVSSIDEHYGYILHNLEWFFTFLFTIEYILRIYSVQKPWKYVFSFMGIVDFLAIIPSLTERRIPLPVGGLTISLFFTLWLSAFEIAQVAAIADVPRSIAFRREIFLGSTLSIFMNLFYRYMIERTSLIKNRSNISRFIGGLIIFTRKTFKVID